MKKYRVCYHSYKEGIDVDKEQIVEARDILNAYDIVEHYCYNIYATFEATKIELVSED